VALREARISVQPLWGFSSSNPDHSQSRAEQQESRYERKQVTMKAGKQESRRARKQVSKKTGLQESK
jgi:hypothetical protein